LWSDEKEKGRKVIHSLAKFPLLHVTTST
jgi:hypothetical protein